MDQSTTMKKLINIIVDTLFVKQPTPKLTKGKQANISRIPPPTPPRPSKSILDKSQYYKKNQSSNLAPKSNNRSYAQASFFIYLFSDQQFITWGARAVCGSYFITTLHRTKTTGNNRESKKEKEQKEKRKRQDN